MRIQIPLTPDLDNETYLQITVKNGNVIAEKLIVDHVNKMRTSEEIFKESNTGPSGYFGQYTRIVDKGKFIVYFPENGELNVVDDETVEFDLRHKIS
tara:strand:+ start:212 stop:502 length:291 start_codon:yes stop_codon:yes gene_type:complete